MVLPRSAPVPFGLRVEQEEWEEREVEVLFGSRCAAAACITGVTGLSLLPFLLLKSQQGRSTGTCHTARQEIETRPKTE
jgi:hypothetical protein